ncbi:hypothetical protein [Kamptonema formosum]|uniref:hypothetical protein n=1 Tax=Kamptonema formosum TaxID=331992 RepID=UPI0012DFE0C8|nr:hypothetical protein [Oscillatoria sp. PCC 10802]
MVWNTGATATALPQTQLVTVATPQDGMAIRGLPVKWQPARPQLFQQFESRSFFWQPR